MTPEGMFPFFAAYAICTSGVIFFFIVCRYCFAGAYNPRHLECLRIFPTSKSISVGLRGSLS